jgi:hypothetical protein
MSCQCKFRNPDECMKKIHDERCRWEYEGMPVWSSKFPGACCTTVICG